MTSPTPARRRASEPVKTISSDFCERSVFMLCSPRHQIIASERLDFPLPLGPTMAVMPGPEFQTGAVGEGLKAVALQALQIHATPFYFGGCDSFQDGCAGGIIAGIRLKWNRGAEPAPPLPPRRPASASELAQCLPAQSTARSVGRFLPSSFCPLPLRPLCVLYKTVCQAPPVGPLFLLSLPSRGQHLAHVSFGDTRQSRFRRQEGHHSNRPLWALTSHRRASELRTGEPHNPLLSSTSDQAHKWRVLPRRFPTPPPLLGCISPGAAGTTPGAPVSGAPASGGPPSCILAGFLPCLKATRVCNCRKCGSKSLRRLAACAARPTALRRYRFPAW